MRTYAEIKKEVDEEKAKRNSLKGYTRDNLVFLLQWPEAENLMMYGYEFDPGFRRFTYGHIEGFTRNNVDYNVYHANTLVVLMTYGKARPEWYTHLCFWTKQPWEVKKEKTELYVPPYANIGDEGGVCMGTDFARSMIAKNYDPKELEKFHDNALSWMLFNSSWTSSLSTRAKFICPEANAQYLPIHGQFKAWEKAGADAVRHFQWDNCLATHWPTAEKLFIHQATSAKGMLKRKR